MALALLVVKIGTTISNFLPKMTLALTTSAPNGKNRNSFSALTLTLLVAEIGTTNLNLPSKSDTRADY